MNGSAFSLFIKERHMNIRHTAKRPENLGFISTRFAGTDGVSLEVIKWASVFKQEGFKCHYFAGELDRPDEVSCHVPEAHFTHPEILEITEHLFHKAVRDRKITDSIHRIKSHIKDELYAFIKKFDIGLLVPENALAIPMNVPLALAITEVIAETGIPTIAHHHDFFWERQHFLTNSAWDYLSTSFPPNLPFIEHCTINSAGSEQLSLRTGISSTIVPNVMDFEAPPQGIDDYNRDVRKAFGIEEDELFILQPTRVVKRKGIEHAIELVSRLNRKAKLVISHGSGDEGLDYENRIREYSKVMGVKTLFISEYVDEQRGTTPDGRKIYTLNDIYPHADLITYPSTFEGFGNAFLEAVYFRKPIVINMYSIYMFDIRPKGFKVVELPGYLTQDAIEQTKKVLDDPRLYKETVDHNFELGRHHFSFRVLTQQLQAVITDCLGVK